MRPQFADTRRPAPQQPFGGMQFAPPAMHQAPQVDPVEKYFDPDYLSQMRAQLPNTPEQMMRDHAANQAMDAIYGSGRLNNLPHAVQQQHQRFYNFTGLRPGADMTMGQAQRAVQYQQQQAAQREHDLLYGGQW